jgi:hypothetical protein
MNSFNLFDKIFESTFLFPLARSSYYEIMEQAYTRMSNIGRPMQLLAVVASCLVDLFQLLSEKSKT